MPRFCALAAASLLALIACASRVEPLRIPDASTVSLIKGTISNSYDVATSTVRESVTITDPRRIQRVIALVGALNSDMSVPSGTYPTPTHTLAFTDSGDLNLVVFIGLNWVGGRNNNEGHSQNRLRGITDDQRSELLRAMGLKDYRF